VKAPIANEVRRLRREAGLTQQGLADAIGTARQTVIAIERGGECNLTTAMRLARRLGTNVEGLFPHHHAAASKEAP